MQVAGRQAACFLLSSHALCPQSPTASSQGPPQSGVSERHQPTCWTLLAIFCSATPGKEGLGAQRLGSPSAEPGKGGGLPGHPAELGQARPSPGPYMATQATFTGD